MIIIASELKANTINGIMAELEDNQEIQEIIRGHNLRGGDFIEALASDLVQDIDINTDDYLHIC
jgi:hypothetical protein